MTVIREVGGAVVPVIVDDLDTDRIIPARFLRCVTFDGLGEHAFADERRDADGKSLNHPLDDERFAGAEVLLAGKNLRVRFVTRACTASVGSGWIQGSGR